MVNSRGQLSLCSSRSLNVLIVEDDLVDQKQMERLLRRSALSIAAIRHGLCLEDALALMDKEAFDVILVDLNLPDSDGLATVTALHKKEPNAAVIVATGQGGDELGLEALATGAQDYLVKGEFDSHTLTRTVRRAVERRQAQRVPQESEHRLKVVLDSILAGVVTADAETQEIIDANPVARDILGLSSEDLRGRACVRLVYKDINPPCEGGAGPSTGVRVGGSSTAEARLVRLDGAEIPVLKSVCTTTIRGREYVITSLIDITELKQSESNLKRAMEEAKNMNMLLRNATARANDMAAKAKTASAAKSRFLANMTHEIRTPMNGVMGMLDLAMDEALSPTVRKYLETCRSSASALLAIINDILDVSKVEAGKVSLEMVECDLDQLLADIDSLMHPQTLDKRLDFDVRLETPVPQVIRTDPTRLRQCLINLVGNAIKFTEAGHVAVKVSLCDEAGQSWVRFDVEDTGIGIPKDRQQVIFESFTQADNSTTRQYGGTGLGLTITRQLVELMGGRIGLTSEEGRGSTFSLILPTGVDPQGVPMITALKRTACPSGRTPHVDRLSGHILVAEDDAVSQRTIETMLSKWGLKVTLAKDGHEATALGASGPFDLILMDLHMPVLSGLDATRFLRAKGVTIPILALSASISKDDVEAGLVAGCNGHLSKPVDRKQLFASLARYLIQDPGLRDPIRLPAEPVKPAADTEREGLKDLIDWRELSDRIDDEDALRQIASVFVSDNGQRMEQLAQAVRVGDLQTVHSLAHAMKGSAGSLSAKPLALAARQLEAGSKETTGPLPVALFSNVQIEFEKVKALLSQPDWIDKVRDASVVTGRPSPA